MADCFAADVDDLHRRWLPREILADIGIPDAAPPSAAAVEDVAVHLTGIIGGGKEGPPPPPPGLASHQNHYRQAAQVCGQQGAVLVAYGGGCIGGGVPAAWPFLPYPPLQWQVTANFAIGAGFPGPTHPPLLPFHGPPPAKRRVGGTGVFLPRTHVHQYQHKAPAKAKERQQQQHRQQQRGVQEETETAQQQNASAALLALPQEWTY
uniref:Uncharacterized protein n=1 Tax=Avena sativa TaxID=4498 RepID=A0ACD5YKQ4_AVESA